MDNLVFTRFLYPKHLVIQTLISCIFEKKCEEALYWAFELYYSEIDVYPIFRNLSSNYYSNCVGLHGFIDKSYKNLDEPIRWGPEIIEDRKKREILAITSIVHNLCIRIPCKNSKNSKVDKRPIIMITKMPTNEYDKVMPYKIRNPSKNNDGLLNAWRRHWEYYGARCPYWTKKIAEFGGVLNHETKRVVFPDDDSLEEFYDTYCFEPDEQSLEVISYILGIYTFT